MQSEQLPFYIGRYHATARLGSGGMGVVYLATDERLNRKVAIKKLLRNPNSSNAGERIRREALLLAQLNHSNIVQLYDVVEDASGIALVMEYVDGCSLDRWQRERTLDLPQKLQLIKQICAGLSRAHGAGIIHRDLKAENILVDSDGTIKITDFGIAKNWREDSGLTREQHVAGSWGAMSPEQAQGKPLDNRSDLFALGVVAYRLLCGQNPFGDNNSPYVIVDRIVKSPHPPASKLAPELPLAVCELLDRLLAKQPEQRPLNAAEVAAELESLLQQIRGSGTSFTRTHSLTATVTSESYFHRPHKPRRKFARAAKITAGALATCAASIAVVLGISLYSPPAESQKGHYIAVLEPAVRGQESLSHNQRLLIGNVQNALKQGLSGRRGLHLISYSESRKLTGQPLANQANSLNADLLLIPDVDCQGRSCELSLELLDSDTLAVIGSQSTRLSMEEGLESRARTLHQLDSLLSDYPAKAANQANLIGAEDYLTYLEIYERRHDYLHLGDLLDQLDSLQKRAPSFAPLYELYAEMAIDQEFNTRAAEAHERLARLLQKAPARLDDTPELLISELRLSMLRDNPGRPEALLAKLKLVLPDKASYHQLSAMYHQQRGDYSRALESINSALALRTSYIYLDQKALILTLDGDMPAANEVLREAIALNSESIDAISLLAGNMLDAGRAQETIRLLTEAGLDRIGPMDTYNLCLAYYIEKQYAQSQTCFKRVSELAPKDADPLLYRAEIAREQQQTKRARDFAQQALQLTQGRSDWEGLLMQARAYAELGEGEKAVENLLKIRRDAPDDLYTNYARAQVYITTGDLLSAKAHIRKTLEQGISPVWYCTARFVKICNMPAFNDLRQQYPGLCGGAEHNNEQQNSAGDSQIARSGETSAKL
ncbi:serine/threonine-protein kinase [Microbulbifer hydrolyticus]|uniref:Protein kinase n=1 Tax=Microbulbifer hydrolyticus TaxID=48074 RepID=A0A6P1T9E3_9GAMM|nr:serine/threonine-protein kinase [Microbulbifer hydrolyticus]MBB5211003.1 serine/threonine-protein kinase [Microbulbifer hydrolyticus]QHQ38186.1 protein kinase [Microbulbifer hydrolyticus]